MISLEDGQKLKSIDSNIIDRASIKSKKKKKKIKKKKEKKCSGLKELLEQIKEEKEEKILKEKAKTQKIEPNKKYENLDSKDLMNIINNSECCTTVTNLSHDDFYEFPKYYSSNKYDSFIIRPNYLIKKMEIGDDDKNEKEYIINDKKKISSPICDYFEGMDKILRKTYKDNIDMTHSLNFIKKEDLMSSFKTNNDQIKDINIINKFNYYINPED